MDEHIKTGSSGFHCYKGIIRQKISNVKVQKEKKKLAANVKHKQFMYYKIQTVFVKKF